MKRMTSPTATAEATTDLDCASLASEGPTEVTSCVMRGNSSGLFRTEANSRASSREKEPVMVAPELRMASLTVGADWSWPSRTMASWPMPRVLPSAILAVRSPNFFEPSSVKVMLT